MITEGFGGQGRALYSFFPRLKDLQNGANRDPGHGKFNPQKLWITQWTTALELSQSPMEWGSQSN